VLQLSTRWEFGSIRKLVLNNIQPPTPHDRLLLARTYSVDNWVTPALSALCARSAPLSLDEARQMNTEDIVVVTTVREDIRNHTLQVDAAEIPRRVKAARAGKLVHIDSVGIPSVAPSGAVERASSAVGQKDYDTEGDYDTGGDDDTYASGDDDVDGDDNADGDDDEALVSPVAVRSRR